MRRNIHAIMSGFIIISLFCIIQLALCQTGPGWQQWNGNNYFISQRADINLLLNYEDASSYCRDRGAFLASTLTEEEALYVKDQYIQGVNGCYFGLYLSAAFNGCPDTLCDGCGNTDRTGDCAACDNCRNQWIWRDGSPMVWQNWNLGQPNEPVRCGRLHGDGKWYDQTCEQQLCFVCKINPNQSTPPPFTTTTTTPRPTTTQPTTTLQPANGPGWQQWNGNNYFISQRADVNLLLNYEDASSYCRDRGAFLASTLTEEETLYIKDQYVLGVNGCYFGLYLSAAFNGCPGTLCDGCGSTDTTGDCAACENCRRQWIWRDGSAMVWQNWNLGQPNEQVRCGRLHGDGKWYDQTCAQQMCFVCKIGQNQLPGSTPGTSTSTTTTTPPRTTTSTTTTRQPAVITTTTRQPAVITTTTRQPAVTTRSPTQPPSSSTTPPTPSPSTSTTTSRLTQGQSSTSTTTASTISTTTEPPKKRLNFGEVVIISVAAVTFAFALPGLLIFYLIRRG